MATGFQMKKIDEENNISRPRDENKGYKQYFESDRPQMMKAVKLALIELKLNYIVPALT